ncbi:MAG: Gfo/Idh/MocA family oxidoreductase [Flavobacteriales bacterium]|nr:MAG: Gfo/Idh/MocA family oxidoreductase [Flavobacteriales bacterium]
MALKSFFKTLPIKWGIIGCGHVTEVKSGPAYQQTDGFKVMAVMRRDYEKAADYAHRHGIPKIHREAEDLILDDEIDAVYIATPPDSHQYYGLMVAAAGKPCCIEKPMATSYDQSVEIYNAFEERQIPLFIAYYRRSLPRFDQIKLWMQQGEIGQIRQVRWHLAKPPTDIDKQGVYNWRTDRMVAPGGYFDDLASHGLDLFVHLLGDIVEAKGIATNQLGLYSAKDSVSACWIHQNGVTGEGSWNFGSYIYEDTAEIIGSEGKIGFSIFDDQPLVLQNAKGKLAKTITHPKHIQKYHVAHIKEHLMGHKRHPSLGKSGLHTSWVMDRILGIL